MLQDSRNAALQGGLCLHVEIVDLNHLFLGEKPGQKACHVWLRL